ncbi:MAG: response regulator transcription factor [Planctomycetes bacterium]|nr:response regulator transcription factor [Planctomycetota bacterium]
MMTTTVPNSGATLKNTKFPGKPWRVLIVDDHELLRDGLRMLLGTDPKLEVCGDAMDETDARNLVRQLNPDLAVVDLTLRNGNGLDLVKWIKKNHPETRVIVLTMHDEKIYGERALRAGAEGFVNKDHASGTILTAIEQVRDGKLFFSEELTRRVMKRTRGSQNEVSPSATDLLSDRELEVFRFIGQGKTSAQIAAELKLAASTVETYRERLKTKLNLTNSAELARHATVWVWENP